MDKAHRIMIVRDSISKIAKILTDDKVMVTQSGVKAFVKYDEKTLKATRVNLPMLPDDASDDLIEAVQGFLDGEISRVLYADGKSSVRAKLEDMEGIYKPIESIFCEREMTKALPGSRLNLSNMHQTFVDRFVSPRLKEAVENGASEQELFQVLAVPALRAMGGQKFFQDYMADKWSLIENLKRELEPFGKKLPGLKKGSDCYEVARDIRNLVMGEPPEDGQSINSPAGDPKGGSKGSNSGDSRSKKGGSSSQGGGSGSSGGGGSEEAAEQESGSGGGGEGEEQEDAGQDTNAGGSGGDADQSEDKDESSEEGADDEGKESESDPGSEEGADEGADDEGEEGAVEPEEVEGEKDDGEKDENDGEDDDSREDERHDDQFGEQGDGGKLEEDQEVSQVEYEGASFITGFDWNKVQDIQDEFGQHVTDLCSKEMKAEPYTVFTREWDSFDAPKIPSAFTPDWISDLENEIKDMVGPVARGLERAFTARNKTLFQQGQTRGRLSSNNLYRLSAGDDRIFKKKIEHKTRDIAVSLVIDCSGSMSGKKIKTAMCAAWVMAEVLQRLGVDNEIIGFTTGYSTGTTDQRMKDLYEEFSADYRAGRHYDRHEPLVMPLFKDFTERFGIEQKRRMASYPRISGAMAGNIDGESVQYAYERLLKHTTKGKPKGRMMIVFSDGMPAAGVDYYKLNDHLKRTVKNIEASGTNIVGIGICSDSVQEFYRKNVSLSNVEDLPGIVLGELREALLTS